MRSSILLALHGQILENSWPRLWRGLTMNIEVWLLLVMTVSFCVGMVHADEGDAARRLEQLGATLTRAKGDPARGVIAVHLKGSRAKDDDLTLLKELPRLETISLNGPNITAPPSHT